MAIFIRAGGVLRDYLHADVDEFTRKVEDFEGRNLREILESIGVPPGHVAMVFLGDKLITLRYAPKEGDVITLRPPVQGG